MKRDAVLFAYAMIFGLCIAALILIYQPHLNRPWIPYYHPNEQPPQTIAQGWQSENQREGAIAFAKSALYGIPVYAAVRAK